MTRQGAARAGRGFALFILNEEMDDIIKIVESLEKSSLLIDDARKTLKHKIKKQEDGFLPSIMASIAASLIAPMASSLTQPVPFSLINSISGKWQEGGFLLLLVLPLRMKVFEKEIRRVGRGYMNKIF